MQLVMEPPGSLAAGRTRQQPHRVAEKLFDGLSVVLAVLGEEKAESVRAALEHAGASVRVVFSLPEARHNTPPFGPRATVVIEPPAITGSIHASLRALSRQGAVLLLGVSATTRERIGLLNSGADSVLPTVDADEVVAALAALLRRSTMPTAKQMSQVVLAGEIRLHLLHRTATTALRTLALTPLEFDLLAYFVARAGEALSRDQLLVNVWGYDIGGRETVTVHVRRLREKLETDPSRPTRLQTVWGIGYRLIPDAASPSIAGPMCSSNGRSVASAVSEQAAT